MYKIDTTKIHTSWLPYLQNEFSKKYFLDIKNFLENENKNGKTIFPKSENVFKAIENLSLNDTKVVIIGQDPYHDKNQAHGLAFSVQNGQKLPPSLKNIFKLIGKNTENGNLEYLTKQGVLLLNAILTVEAHKPASHSKIGWENFTDKIIKTISEQKENVIFLLWGAFAQKKEYLIDNKKHIVFKTTHPSPFSAHKGFLKDNHFKKTNEILKSLLKKEIDW